MIKIKNFEEYKRLSDENVRDILSKMCPINEMAVPLKIYRERVDGLRFQLVENWCLCKYCQLFNPKCDDFSHWISELKACIKNLKFLNIKNGINKKKIITKLLIDDYDYNDANLITLIIQDKFEIEEINDSNILETVATEFANNIQKLIDVISIDTESISSYIENNFIETHDTL